jgi:hypothetical protein
MAQGFELIELLVEEGAGVFDVVDVAGVAEAAFATQLLGRTTAAGFEGFGFLVCGGHGAALECLVYDTARVWADRGFVSICKNCQGSFRSGVALGTMGEVVDGGSMGIRWVWLGLAGWGLAAGAMATVAMAMPAGSRSGFCYLFRNDGLVLTQSCGIELADRLAYGIDYGLGGRSIRLNWADGMQTTIVPTYGGGMTVDGLPAVSYQRGGVFLQPIVGPFGAELDDRIFCERIVQNNDSICYRFLN